MHIDKFERYWIVAASLMLGAFFAALIASTIVFGVHLPDPAGRINPADVEDWTNQGFATPGLRDMGDNHYEAHIVAQMWLYNTGDVVDGVPTVRVPQGAVVTFNVASKDVTHGFYIEYHNVNIMVIPGQISRATVTFNRPGTYRIVCHEYCGNGHHNMNAQVIVEPSA
ncbi:MAG: cytochrome C oxidase subunit II [Anaerolineaceae bacterium]|nr:cytochrome C oxidase subunit II [Anaerolineaceae bacterium]